MCVSCADICGFDREVPHQDGATAILRGAIADAGLSATPLEMVVTELENRPGTGAELFRRLADAGVNLRAAVPIGMGGDKVQLALAADDAAALKAALGG